MMSLKMKEILLTDEEVGQNILDLEVWRRIHHLNGMFEFD